MSTTLHNRHEGRVMSSRGKRALRYLRVSTPSQVHTDYNPEGIAKRPRFQDMLARIKSQRDVDYVIVYHFNRIFRNSVDAAIVKRDLRKLGVRIVSSIMDLGDSPESAMVESIIHAVDQYQSEASGADRGEHKGSSLPEERASLDRLTRADLLTVALGPTVR